MATQNLVCGLRPLMQGIQGNPSRVAAYAKPASDTNPIYMFDLVMRVSATSVQPPEGGNPLLGIQGGNKGTAGTGLWLGPSLNYGAASTLTVHSVVDDPDAIFLVQSDSSSAQTIASLGTKNANLNVSGAANAQLGPIGNLQSGMTLKSSTVATTAGLDVRILNLWDSPFNPDNAKYPILEVNIVLHQFKGQSVGV